MLLRPYLNSLRGAEGDKVSVFMIFKTLFHAKKA